MRPTLIAIGVLFVAIIAARIAFIEIAGPVIPEALVNQLKTGMSHEEITDLLGPPSEIDGSGCWYYFKSWNPGWANVYFDERGEYVSVSQELAFP
jgi:outer membrane protein assembly factor BamE (lipoprotein component of BamABCDE complex)